MTTMMTYYDYYIRQEEATADLTWVLRCLIYLRARAWAVGLAFTRTRSTQLKQKWPATEVGKPTSVYFCNSRYQKYLVSDHFSELHAHSRQQRRPCRQSPPACHASWCLHLNGTNLTLKDLKENSCSTMVWTMSCYGVWVSHGLPMSLLGPKKSTRNNDKLSKSSRLALPTCQGIWGAISHHSHEAFLPGNAQRSGQPNAIVDAQHHAAALHNPGTSHQLLSREAGIVASIPPPKEPTV